MELALVFIGLPLVSYLALASLPRGRPALLGIAVAAIVIAVVWVTLTTGGGDSFMIALMVFLFSATSLAAIVQALRHVIGPDRPRWVYPVLVVIALLAAGIPMLSIVGV